MLRKLNCHSVMSTVGGSLMVQDGHSEKAAQLCSKASPRVAGLPAQSALLWALSWALFLRLNAVGRSREQHRMQCWLMSAPMEACTKRRIRQSIQAAYAGGLVFCSIKIATTAPPSQSHRAACTSPALSPVKGCTATRPRLVLDLYQRA